MSRTSLLLTLAVVAAPPLAAQTCSVPNPAGNCPVTVTMTAVTVSLSLQLTVSNASTALTKPAPGDFDVGYKQDTGPVVTVQSNSPWTLTFKAGAATWTAANTDPGAAARLNKPSTDLQWAPSAGGSYAGLSSVTAVTLGTGSATNSTVYTIFYRTLYSWTADTPGNYSLPVVFTLTSP